MRDAVDRHGDAVVGHGVESPDQIAGGGVEARQHAGRSEDVDAVAVNGRRGPGAGGEHRHDVAVGGRPFARPEDRTGLLVERHESFLAVHRAATRRLLVVEDEDASVGDGRSGEASAHRGAPLDDEPAFGKALDDTGLAPHRGPVDTAPLRPVFGVERGGQAADDGPGERRDDPAGRTTVRHQRLQFVPERADSMRVSRSCSRTARKLLSRRRGPPQLLVDRGAGRLVLEPRGDRSPVAHDPVPSTDSKSIPKSPRLHPRVGTDRTTKRHRQPRLDRKRNMARPLSRAVLRSRNRDRAQGDRWPSSERGDARRIPSSPAPRIRRILSDLDAAVQPGDPGRLRLANEATDSDDARRGAPGRDLRNALAAEGWTVTEAAAKLGCTRQTFLRLLTGGRESHRGLRWREPEDLAGLATNGSQTRARRGRRCVYDATVTEGRIVPFTRHGSRLSTGC